MKLIIALRSELLKTKRTAAFYFTIIGAAVIPFILLCSTLSHDLPQETESHKDPINFMFGMCAEVMSLCIFPMFLMLICTLLAQIEYKNTAWKQVLTSPQTKLNVFVSKFLNVQLLILLFFAASHVFTWMVVIVAHFKIPHINVLQHSFDLSRVLADYADVYLSTLAICVLQFLIGIRSKNFIVPIAIGIACWLAGTVLVLEYHSKSSLFFPYSFHAIKLSSDFGPRLSQVEWTSVGYAVFFLVIGFWDFKRRR